MLFNMYFKSASFQEFPKNGQGREYTLHMEMARGQRVKNHATPAQKQKYAVKASLIFFIN